MRTFSNADVPCRDCGRMTRWVTTPNHRRMLVDADASDDGVWALDYRVGETVARWVASDYRADLRERVGLYAAHECVAFSRRSA